MQNIFLDTNILIDFFADRKPFSTEAAKLFSYSFKKKINPPRPRLSEAETRTF
ncbi:MAG: hypothetical protein ACK504_03290 [Bacteroidota bacterium]